MIIIGGITGWKEKKNGTCCFDKEPVGFSGSRSQPQLWSRGATSTECHQAGPAAVSSTASSEQPDLNKASSFTRGTSEWGYLRRLWFSCSVDVGKKKKANKVVVLTCWRVITTKSREGKRSGCEEDERDVTRLPRTPRNCLCSPTLPAPLSLFTGLIRSSLTCILH